MKYIQLQQLLHEKMSELERLCHQEKSLLSGKLDSPLLQEFYQAHSQLVSWLMAHRRLLPTPMRLLNLNSHFGNIDWDLLQAISRDEPTLHDLNMASLCPHSSFAWNKKQNRSVRFKPDLETPFSVDSLRDWQQCPSSSTLYDEKVNKKRLNYLHNYENVTFVNRNKNPESKYSNQREKHSTFKCMADNNSTQRDYYTMNDPNADWYVLEPDSNKFLGLYEKPTSPVVNRANVSFEKFQHSDDFSDVENGRQYSCEKPKRVSSLDRNLLQRNKTFYIKEPSNPKHHGSLKISSKEKSVRTPMIKSFRKTISSFNLTSDKENDSCNVLKSRSYSLPGICFKDKDKYENNSTKEKPLAECRSHKLFSVFRFCTSSFLRSKKLTSCDSLPKKLSKSLSLDEKKFIQVLGHDKDRSLNYDSNATINKTISLQELKEKKLKDETLMVNRPYNAICHINPPDENVNKISISHSNSNFACSYEKNIIPEKVNLFRNASNSKYSTLPAYSKDSSYSNLFSLASSSFDRNCETYKCGQKSNNLDDISIKNKRRYSATEKMHMDNNLKRESTETKLMASEYIKGPNDMEKESYLIDRKPTYTYTKNDCSYFNIPDMTQEECANFCNYDIPGFGINKPCQRSDSSRCFCCVANDSSMCHRNYSKHNAYFSEKYPKYQRPSHTTTKCFHDLNWPFHHIKDNYTHGPNCFNSCQCFQETLYRKNAPLPTSPHALCMKTKSNISTFQPPVISCPPYCPCNLQPRLGVQSKNYGSYGSLPRDVACIPLPQYNPYLRTITTNCCSSLSRQRSYCTFDQNRVADEGIHGLNQCLDHPRRASFCGNINFRSSIYKSGYPKTEEKKASDPTQQPQPKKNPTPMRSFSP